MGWVVGDGKRIKTRTVYLLQGGKSNMFQGGKVELITHFFLSGTKGLAPSCSRGRELEVGGRSRGGEVTETAEALLPPRNLWPSPLRMVSVQVKGHKHSKRLELVR